MMAKKPSAAVVCGLTVMCCTAICDAQPATSADLMLARYQRAAEIQAANAHRWILNENVVPH